MEQHDLTQLVSVVLSAVLRNREQRGADFISDVWVDVSGFGKGSQHDMPVDCCVPHAFV